MLSLKLDEEYKRDNSRLFHEDGSARREVVDLTADYRILVAARFCLEQPFNMEGLNDRSIALVRESFDDAITQAEGDRDPQVVVANRWRIDALGRAVLSHAQQVESQSVPVDSNNPAYDPSALTVLLRGLAVAATIYPSDAAAEQAFNQFNVGFGAESAPEGSMGDLSREITTAQFFHARLS